jgi:hypothetical protein
MHSLFHIQIDHIRALDDGQARELLARLCRSHVQRAGLDPAVVFWGGNQRASDGGVDVRVDCQPATDISGPLSRSVAIVQVKAEPFEPAKIGPEMAPKGVIRPSIASLATDGGMYVIASTRDDPADPRRADRVAAMEKVLDKHGLAGKIKVDFLGARQIADWVEEFPPLAIWVRERIGKPIQGWNGYGPWAYKETDQDAEFVVGTEPRVFGPGATDGMTDLQAIEAIRRDLAAGGTVRLVGLSGVGKTRLAQALFDPRIQTDTPALSQDWAIYTDISNGPDPSPEAMIEALASSSAPSILIVDNCGQKSHAALVERKAKTAKTLGLLTIEYDIQDDLPEDTVFYRLEGASDETISVLLRARNQHLSLNDVHTVIAASDGNSRLAFALASTSKYTDDLSSLKDGELFRRLFEQTQGAGDELLRCAKAASLIYSFDGEDVSPTSEMAILAGFAGTTVADFRRNMVDLKRRGLLQERGKWRALLPHAVSNRLAAQALEEQLASEVEDRLFTHAPERVRSSFAHRLSFLHGSKDAQSLVARWMASDGPLGAPTLLSDQGFHIFQRLAPVDQVATLDAIDRSVSSKKASDLDEFRIEKLASITNSLAYEVINFDRCIDVLVKLALMQSANRSRRERQPEYLIALFQAYGSGTLALASQRAPHIKRLLASGDTTEYEIGVALLAETLKVRGFRRHGTFQFGARTRTQGWRAKDEAEHRQWYETFLTIAEPMALQNNESGKTMRAALAKTIAGFVYDPSLLQHLERLAPEFLRIDGWLPSLQAVRQLLRDKDLRGDRRTRAEGFEQLVSPQGLRAQVLAAIAVRDPYDYAKLREEGGDVYERMAANSLALGRELAGDPALLQDILPQLLEGEIYRQAHSIGQGVAIAFADTKPLIDMVRTVVQAASERKSCNLTFVGGLFRGWHERDPALASRLLDEALNDPILGPWFPALQLQVPLDARGAARLVASIDADLAPITSYQFLGPSLKTLDLVNIASVLNALTTKGPEGNYSAIDALSYVVYAASDREPEWKDALATFCRDFMVRAEWPPIREFGERLDHEISQILAFGVRHSRSFRDVRPLLKRVEDYRRDSSGYVPSDSGNYLAPILHRYPAETLSVLNQRRSIEQRHRVDDMVLDAWHTNHMGVPGPVMAPDTLIEWCAVDPPKRIAFASRICPLDLPVEGAPSVVARLYALAPDKGVLIQAVLGRCMRATTSSEDLPNLNAGIELLENLPAAPGSPEAIQRDQAVRDLRERIEWWNQMLGRTGRERDEGFE